MKRNERNVLYWWPCLLATLLLGGAVQAEEVNPTAQDIGMALEPSDEHGWTPLMEAAWEGHTEAVKALLDAGAEINAREERFELSALMFASGRGHTEAVKALLDAGADPNLADNYRETPLMAASDKGHAEVIKALLDAGADPNLRNIDGLTALMSAAGRGYSEVVRHLMAAGAAINATDKNGWTARGHASFGNQIRFLLDAQAAGLATVEQELWLALVGGEVEQVPQLLEKGADPNYTLTVDGVSIKLLRMALGMGHTKAVQHLLSAGASHGPLELFRAAEGGHEEVVKALLSAGADPSGVVKIEGKRWTPLKAAREGGHDRVAKALLAAGADRWAHMPFPQRNVVRWLVEDLGGALGLLILIVAIGGVFELYNWLKALAWKPMGTGRITREELGKGP